MHLKDLLCHSLTQSVSQSVSDKDGHHVCPYVSISMSRSLHLCTFIALTLHQPCTPNLCSTRIYYFFFVCVLSLSQVPDSGSIQNNNIICIKNIIRLSRIVRKWIYIDLDVESDLFLIFCFLNFSELEIYADSYPNHFPPFTSNSSFEVSSSESFTSLRSRFSICFLCFLSLSFPPLQDHRL